MKKIFLHLFILFSVVAACPLGAYATTYFVDATKPDNTGNGLSWSTAKKDIQDAINIAVSGDNVWVKTGTYLPTQDPSGNLTPADLRDKTIYLKNGVKLYGSFVGTETTLSQRTGSVVIANPTTISGDIGTPNTNTDNCYHVVTSVSDAANTIIDGFIISGGYSAPTDLSFITVETKIIPRNVGAGMYLNSSNTTVSSCAFNANVAGVSGGGMYNDGSNPTLFNCLFVTNYSVNGGGMCNAGSGSANISNCQFYGNRVFGGNGAGIFNTGVLTGTTIINSTFNSNITDKNGGAIYNGSGSHVITNCSFYTNKGTGAASVGGGIYFAATIGGTIKNSIFYDDQTVANTTDANREEIYKVPGTALVVSYSIVKDYVSPGTSTTGVTFGSGMLNSDPLFVSAFNLSIQAGSPAINASDPATTTPPTDITGFTRTGVFDMGAYEYQVVCLPTTSTTTLSACDSLIWNGTVYKTTGTYAKTGFINAAGCDSTAVLALTITNGTTSETTVAVCNSFFWNDSTYKVSGDYVYHTTNSAGCDSAATLHLTILSVTSTYTKTDAICFGSATGSIVITPTYGVSPFAYRIGTVSSYGPSNTFTNLRTGNYRVSILDANGCAGISAQITIAQQAAITGTTSKTDAGCYGSATGSITVTLTNGSSPYQYKLGSGGTYGSSNTFSGLKAGNYRITIQDANGCTGVVTETISQSPEITGTYTKTDVVCYGKATGTLTIIPTSGVAPYTYRVGTTGAFVSSNVFTGLRAGNLRVYINDANGCQGNLIATINQPASAISATSTKTDESCPKAKDGSLTVTAAGGTGPYTYRYGTSGAYTTTNSFSNLKAGSYRVYVQDANGCTGYSLATIIGLTSPTCNANKAIVAATTLEKASITLAPNPANNQFRLMLPVSDKSTTVRVLDINGKILYTAKTTSQSITFGQDFATGIYMVEVRQGETVKTLKAVKIN